MEHDIKPLSAVVPDNQDENLGVDSRVRADAWVASAHSFHETALAVLKIGLHILRLLWSNILPQWLAFRVIRLKMYVQS
jgi:hypothetical protein